MPNLSSLKIQFKQNLLALISIAIAITALSYNSWRNEQSEENRNYRAAGFEILRESARLQLLIDTATYSDEPQKMDPIKGWVQVNLILSLSEIISPDVNESAINLKQVWTDNWSSIVVDEKANQNVSKANLQLVVKTRELLASLR